MPAEEVGQIPYFVEVKIFMGSAYGGSMQLIYKNFKIYLPYFVRSPCGGAFLYEVRRKNFFAISGGICYFLLSPEAYAYEVRNNKNLILNISSLRSRAYFAPPSFVQEGLTTQTGLTSLILRRPYFVGHREKKKH